MRASVCVYVHVCACVCVFAHACAQVCVGPYWEEGGDVWSEICAG